jgi:Leucine-rich repeat (LRR) protein
MQRSQWLPFLACVSLSAADPDSWIQNAGGAVSRNSRGQIVAVDLRASWITDSDLTDLARLPALERLDLSLTRIGDHGLQQLKNAPGITDLNLYFDELVGDGGLSAIKGWRHLKRLSARGTKITDMTVQYLASVPSLEAVDLGFAQLTDVGLDPLASLPNLKELTIGGNKLTDSGLQPLRQLTSLTYLDLSGAQRTDSGLWSVSLTESGFDVLAMLKRLHHLRLNGLLVTSRGLEKLKTLAQLERLDLQGCQRVTDDAIPVLASFPALRLLDLTGTAVTGKGIDQLRRTKPECKVIGGSLTGPEATHERTPEHAD